MSETTENSALLKLSDEEQAVLNTVMYFDGFGYPLKPSEVHQYAPIKMSALNVLPCLNYMVNHGLMFQQGNFFSMRDDAALVQKRQDSKSASVSMIKAAKRLSSLISRFPFVRSICITGNLARGFVSAEDYLEFFIIAKPGRLWLARALLLGFKKVFLLNNKRYFNMNYFVDSEKLEIPDKNLYTATQLKTLVPVYNAELYQQFVKANEWATEFLPNMKPVSIAGVSALKVFPIRATIEGVFNLTIGGMLNKKYQRGSIKNWKLNCDISAETVAMLDSGSYISIPLVAKTQYNILNAYATNSNAFKSQHETNLT